MSLQQLIRDVMGAAGDGMKAGEIREAVGPDDYTSEQVGAALYALEKAGAVEKLGERGTYRYHLVPGYKPRRQAAAGAEAAKKPGAKVAAKAERKAARAAPSAPSAPTETPRAELLLAGTAALPPPKKDWPFETIMLSRRTVRALIAGVLMFGGDLGDELRQAVRDATEAAA
jgi:DNA-binding transcriptional ArsR family regulator